MLLNNYIHTCIHSPVALGPAHQAVESSGFRLRRAWKIKQTSQLYSELAVRAASGKLETKASVPEAGHVLSTPIKDEKTFDVNLIL